MPTQSEAARILAYAAASDNRTVTEAAALAWSRQLAHYVTFEDAAVAIDQHYARTRDFVMPADVNAGVKRLRVARIDSAPFGEIPDGLSEPQHRAWLGAYRAALGDGQTPGDAQAAADEAVGATRPPRIVADPERVARLINAAQPPRPPKTTPTAHDHAPAKSDPAETRTAS